MRIATASAGRGRPRVRVTGSLRRVGVRGTRGPSALQAELADGEGSVTLIWLGRDHIAGIEPGRALSAEGTLTLRRGRRVIYNPRYELRAVRAEPDGSSHEPAVSATA